MRLIAGLLPPALLSASLLAGCSGDRSEPAEPTAAPPASPTPTTAGGGPVADLHMVCSGESSPTIVLIAGLDTSGDTFEDVQGRLAPTARTCWYDRVGLGSSPLFAEGAPDPSPGSAAADLHASLAAVGYGSPYVVVGWSYGGLVAQAYAAAYPDDVAGLVLEDTSVREQFTDPELIDDSFVWSEGGREIDVEALEHQLAELDFGDLPLAVLSQDMHEPWTRAWLRYHDDLARSSTDGVHVVGVGSGHEMHVDVPDLVAAAVESVVAAVADGSRLGQCDARFTDAGGRCRAL